MTSCWPVAQWGTGKLHGAAHGCRRTMLSCSPDLTASIVEKLKSWMALATCSCVATGSRDMRAIDSLMRMTASSWRTVTGMAGTELCLSACAWRTCRAAAAVKVCAAAGAEKECGISLPGGHGGRPVTQVVSAGQCQQAQQELQGIGKACKAELPRLWQHSSGQHLAAHANVLVDQELASLLRQTRRAGGPAVLQVALEEGLLLHPKACLSASCCRGGMQLHMPVALGESVKE